MCCTCSWIIFHCLEGRSGLRPGRLHKLLVACCWACKNLSGGTDSCRWSGKVNLLSVFTEGM